MKIKLRDAEGRRSKADITSLDAMIRYEHRDGTEFFFERVGQYEYLELSTTLADRIRTYLTVMKKKPQELSLKEIDEMRKIEEEERNAKKSDSCNDHARTGRPCAVVSDDASRKEVADEDSDATESGVDRPLDFPQ